MPTRSNYINTPGFHLFEEKKLQLYLIESSYLIHWSGLKFFSFGLLVTLWIYGYDPFIVTLQLIVVQAIGPTPNNRTCRKKHETNRR